MLGRCSSIAELACHIERHGTKRSAVLAAHESAEDEASGLFMAKHGMLVELRELAARGEWCPHSARDRHGIRALQWAAGGDHTDVCRFLVNELAVLVDAGSREGRTPLMWACRNGCVGATRALIEELGANVTATTKKGVTALHWSAWSGEQRCVEMCLRAGGAIEHRSKAGCTAAIWACSVPVPLSGGAQRSIDMVCYLHSLGADVAAASNWGNSCLAKAVYKGNRELVVFLLDVLGRAEDLLRRNTKGERPLDIAEQCGYASLSALLRERMAASAGCTPGPTASAPGREFGYVE